MLTLVDNDQDNAFLKRKKKSIRNKFKPTQSNTIEEANLLAVYLVVIGRTDEAHKLLKSYAEEIPYDEHRWERWEATCKAILLLSSLEQNLGNKQESERLCKIVLNNDYEVGGDDKIKLFWKAIEGFNAAQLIIECEELKQNDTCKIYAETYQSFLYFEQLSPHFGVFKQSDGLVLQANIADLKSKLSYALVGNKS